MAEIDAFSSYLCSTVRVAHSHRTRGPKWADDPAAWQTMQAIVPQSVGNAFAAIESHYLRGPYATGSQLTTSNYDLLNRSRLLEADGVAGVLEGRVLK